MGAMIFSVKSIKKLEITNRHKIDMLLYALEILESTISKNNREFVASKSLKAIPIRERISLESKEMKYSLTAKEKNHHL